MRFWSLLASLFARLKSKPVSTTVSVNPAPAAQTATAPASPKPTQAQAEPPKPTSQSTPTPAAKAPDKQGRLAKAAVVAFAVSSIGGFEGLRLTSYPDPASHGAPYTICYGHTGGIKAGETVTLAQCKAWLIQDLGSAANGIEACVTAPMGDKRFVALMSFAYNVGVTTACKSSVVRDLNAGNATAGCGALLLYNKAAGITLQGLTNRRKAEQQLCLENN